MHDAGVALLGEPKQVRTWNLSSLWRLPTAKGDAWLKVVPPFFAHEGAVLEALRDAPVPRLIARDGPRLLMAQVAGHDGYGAQVPDTLAMVDVLVEIQSRWLDRADDLLALGVPDWRAGAFGAAFAELLRRRGGDLAPVVGRHAIEEVPAVRAHWSAAWRRALPKADVERAADLVAPVAAARQALIYQRFIDRIEDAEHPYHRADVGAWLARTAQRLRES